MAARMATEIAGENCIANVIECLYWSENFNDLMSEMAEAFCLSEQNVIFREKVLWKEDGRELKISDNAHKIYTCALAMKNSAKFNKERAKHVQQGRSDCPLLRPCGPSVLATILPSLTAVPTLAHADFVGIDVGSFFIASLNRQGSRAWTSHNKDAALCTDGSRLEM